MTYKWRAVFDSGISRCSTSSGHSANASLYAENVHVQVHYLPVYWHSYYEKLGYPKGLCPNAEYLYEHVMSIPLFYSMTDEDVESIITAIKKVLAYYRR